MIYISPETKKQFIERRNEIGTCPCCNSNIKDKPVSIHRDMIIQLYQVCKWCKANNTVIFRKRDINHIFISLKGLTGSARFGDWRYVTELMEKRGSEYKIDLLACVEFFKGDLEIPLNFKVNQITDEVCEKTMGKVSDVKEIREWLEGENKIYNPHINPYVI